MKQETKNIRISVLLGFIGLATITRVAAPAFFAHPVNVAPINAIALFSGAYFARKWFSFIIPLLAVWVSDFFVTMLFYGKLQLFYEGFYWQYGTYILLVAIGWLFHEKVKFAKVSMATLGGSLLFFTVSNFGVWATGLLYPMTASGLAICYVAGIPFFGQTLISDICFSALLFGGFEFARYKFPVLLANPQRT
jgi:hypothetical protein